MADNDGAQPRMSPIVAGGADALLCTLPVHEIVDAIRADGIPAEISRHAGTYLCNHLYYELLRRADDFSAVFLHLPSLPECAAVADGAHPSMSLDTSRSGVEAALGLVALLPA